MTKLWTIPIGVKLISKSNHKGRTHYLPKKYSAFEELIARVSWAVCRKPLLEAGWVVIRPHFKNKVHNDLNNLNKSCFDGLVKGGVFRDDKYIACTVLPAVYGDENSEVEIWA